MAPMPQDPFVEDMTNAELRASRINLIQFMMAQTYVINNCFVTKANQGMGPQPNASNPASRIRDFMRMNPPMFHCSKVDEYPLVYIDYVVKVVDAMCVTPREKVDLTS